MEKMELKKGLLLISYAGLVLLAIFNISSIFSFLGYILEIIYPFLIGFAIAFILSIINTKVETTLYKNIKKHKRFLSFVTTLLIILGFIILICFIVGPQLILSIKELGIQLPNGYNQLISLLQDNRDIFGGNLSQFIDYLINLNIDTQNILQQISSNWETIFDSGYSLISSTFNVLYTFFIGLIFSFYIIFYKEKICRQIRYVSNTLIGSTKTKKISNVIKLSSDTFSNFITCQCLEACILGTMFVIAMTIFGFDYAILMGVIIALTALVPVFGAFVGCLIGIILIGLVNPIQAIWFIVLFLALQQIEGNFIYPHVVGNSVGLPSIWVFVAVIIGGKLMGFMGMFIFIPITSIIYTLFKTYIKEKSIKTQV